MNGAEYLLIGAAPEIGATDALHEERIARKQDIAIAREMKRRTAGRMAGRVDHTHLDTLACDCIAIAHETVDNTALRRGHTDPLRLHVQLFEKEKIGFVNCRGGAEAFLQILNGTDVIDVRMRANDLLCAQAVLFQPREDFRGIIAGIDDDRLARVLITKDGAVTAQQSDRKGFDNHGDVYQSPQRHNHFFVPLCLCGDSSFYLRARHFQSATLCGSPALEIHASNQFFIARWKFLFD